MTAKLAYLAIHTQGYDSYHDFALLAAPADRLAEMETLAERICSQNGKYRRVDPRYAYGVAENSPQFLYGWPGDDDAPASVRLAQCAERTVADFGASNAQLMSDR